MARPVAGFTLIELVVVIIIAGIIAAVVGAKWNARSATAPFQAELLARNIRHAQMLAMTWNTPISIALNSPTQYEFRCGKMPPATCPVPPSVTPPFTTLGGTVINDPAMGGPFLVDLENGVTMAVLVGPLPAFDQLGRPFDGGGLIQTSRTLQLDAGGTTWSVSITPLTGFVTVGSP